ncbi:MAG: hypothetical protein U5N56_03115 [Candidatus Marinimicrobia bacterium]|nr:hypothetical protein [Candidatus Neomarinimicrobiota bacterium]
MMTNYPEFEAMLLEQEAGASTILFKYINILKRYFSEHDGLSKKEQKKNWTIFIRKSAMPIP